MRLNNYYKDRGIQKYSGFYLSEHNATIDKEISRDYNIIKAKEKMDEHDIYKVLDQAILKQCPLSIQLDTKDIQGQFMEDITGHLQGYQDDFIVINNISIHFSQIRNIQLATTEKWFS